MAKEEVVDLVSSDEEEGSDSSGQQLQLDINLRCSLNMKRNGPQTFKCEILPGHAERITASPEKLYTARKSCSSSFQPKVMESLRLSSVKAEAVSPVPSKPMAPHRNSSHSQSSDRSNHHKQRHITTFFKKENKPNIAQLSPDPPLTGPVAKKIKLQSPAVTSSAAKAHSEPTPGSSRQKELHTESQIRNKQVSSKGHASHSHPSHPSYPSHPSHSLQQKRQLSWSELKDFVHSQMSRVGWKNVKMPIAQVKHICQSRGLTIDPDMVQMRMTAPKRLLSQAERYRQTKLGPHADHNVLRIKDFRVNERGGIKFLVEWRDSIGEDNWQPADCLTNTKAMHTFEHHLRQSFQLQEDESGERLRHFKKMILSEMAKREVADRALLRRLASHKVFDELDGDVTKLIYYIRNRFRVWHEDEFKRKHDSEGSIDEDSDSESDSESGILMNTTLEVILRSLLKCKESLEEVLTFRDRRLSAAPKLTAYKDWINQRIREQNDMRPIDVSNIVDDAVPPQFEYMSDYVPSSDVMWSESPLHSCLDNCICARPLETQETEVNECPCLVGHTPYPYNRNRELKYSLVAAEEPIYECNTECSCVMSGGCPQKVATAKSPFRFEVFRKATGKWAVRTKEDIPGRRFVMRFTGRLMTQGEVRQKYKEAQTSKRKVISLDFLPEMRSELLHYVDASDAGNISRFLNHSCDPNLIVRAVFSGNYNVYQPRVALFAKRTIRTGEELTFDTQIDRSVDPNAAMRQHVDAESDFFGFYGNPANRLHRVSDARALLFPFPRKRCKCGTPTCRVYLN